MNIQLLKDRTGFGQWCNDEGLLGFGVEVGVNQGDNAMDILRRWNGCRLYLVDPWAPQSSSVYKEDQERFFNYTKAYQHCLSLALLHSPRVDLLRLLSHQAVGLFPDRSLDFVYIDANHSYEAVMQDLNLWYPKVSRGGVIAGHDYYNKVEPPWHCEVKKAVDEFFTISKPHITEPCRSWWVVKT